MGHGALPPLGLVQIGNLSNKIRVVRIKNVLTSQEDTVEVPTEVSVGFRV
jgi:hypothetical protein